MKRLWSAAALLVAIFCAMLYNTHFLCRFSGELAQALEQAEAYAEQGDWRRAESMTRQAYDLWQSRDSYLHITLRHADTDLIYSGFREVLEFITCQEAGEYSAANARLLTEIELLYEAEQLTLKNVL
jgi:hypothetical protein